jgi:hypothetical protein
LRRRTTCATPGDAINSLEDSGERVHDCGHGQLEVERVAVTVPIRLRADGEARALVPCDELVGAAGRGDRGALVQTTPWRLRKRSSPSSPSSIVYLPFVYEAVVVAAQEDEVVEACLPPCAQCRR